MTHEVFISHSSRDRATADVVCSMLERNGVRCWYAPRDVPPGDDWNVAILKAIAASRVMVLIFSSNSNLSTDVTLEVKHAGRKRIPLIPFRIEEVEPSQTLEYYITFVQWLDAWTPPLEDHLPRLLEHVKGFTDRPESKKAEASARMAAQTAAANKPEQPKQTEASPAIKSSETLTPDSPSESATPRPLLPTGAQISSPPPRHSKQRADALPPALTSRAEKPSAPESSAIGAQAQQTSSTRKMESSQPPVTFHQAHSPVRTRALNAPLLAAAMGIAGVLLLVALLFAVYVFGNRFALPTIENQNPTASSVIGREGTIIQSDVKVRSDPSTDNPWIGVAELGSRVRVLNVTDNWYEIEVLQHGRFPEYPTGSERGWVDKRYIKLD
jgi:hypothetical protein